MEGGALSEAQGRMFGPILLNTIAAATLDAPELTGNNKPPRQQAHERIRLKALEFIECSLSNPRLDTVMIAEHCRVSVRHLHASFKAASIAVGALIREMRLQHCRMELINPVLHDQSIIRIAMKWGFASSGSFTRAYQRRFGMAPSESRVTQGLSNADHDL
jgi:transcriptional regulator GlxA family with amidase domain